CCPWPCSSCKAMDVSFSARSVFVFFEVTRQNEFGDPTSQAIAFLDGVPVVHSTKHPCMVHLSHDILEARELMDCAGNRAGHGVGNLVSAKEVGQRIHQSLSGTSVVGGVLRMAWCNVERNPVRVRHRVWIAIGIGVMNRGVGTPESEMIFGVHAGNE